MTTEIPPKYDKKVMARYPRIAAAINNIASTSASILHDLKHGIYSRYTGTEKEPFWYSDKKLSAVEEAFYTRCQTAGGVLSLHHQHIEDDLTQAGPYELFPVHRFSEIQLQGNSCHIFNK